MAPRQPLSRAGIEEVASSWRDLRGSVSPFLGTKDLRIPLGCACTQASPGLSTAFELWRARPIEASIPLRDGGGGPTHFESGESSISDRSAGLASYRGAHRTRRASSHPCRAAEVQKIENLDSPSPFSRLESVPAPPWQTKSPRGDNVV